tara:strand:+ start:305 stop:604 length:300 start_codon:yes stop_codon:yes gene_type:complete
MNFRENMSRSKEVLGAYFRQGLRELGSVFAEPGSAAQHPEYGMISTKLPSELADDMKPENEPSTSNQGSLRSNLDSHIQDARDAQPHEPQQDDRDMDRD